MSKIAEWNATNVQIAKVMAMTGTPEQSESAREFFKEHLGFLFAATREPAVPVLYLYKLTRQREPGQWDIYDQLIVAAADEDGARAIRPKLIDDPDDEEAGFGPNHVWDCELLGTALSSYKEATLIASVLTRG